MTSLFHIVRKLIRSILIMAAFWAFTLYNVVGFVPTFRENIPYTVYYMSKKSKKTTINYITLAAKPSNFTAIILV